VAGNDERHFGRPTDIAWLPDGTKIFYAAEAAGGRTQKFTPKPGGDPAMLVGRQQPLAPLKKP
jgi:hypothetical protein